MLSLKQKPSHGKTELRSATMRSMEICPRLRGQIQQNREIIWWFIGFYHVSLRVNIEIITGRFKKGLTHGISWWTMEIFMVSLVICLWFMGYYGGVMVVQWNVSLGPISHWYSIYTALTHHLTIKSPKNGSLKEELNLQTWSDVGLMEAVDLVNWGFMGQSNLDPAKHWAWLLERCPQTGVPPVIHFEGWDCPWNKPTNFCGSRIFGNPHILIYYTDLLLIS